ncbi:MAG: tetratricopeptide repeat protein [Candidatus Helarchaeota archaeon]|nr:tetratricopeptide repeat protein [Candidatus Helarchaeota archaeon]
MKRYKKNQIYRTISQNKILIISAIGLFVSIFCLVMGIWLGTYSTSFILVPICGGAIIIALIFLVPRIPWISPRFDYLLNKERVEQEIKVFEKADNKIGLALSLIAMGDLYGGIKNLDFELDYYLQALAIFEELEKDEARAMTCQPIASIFEKFGDFFSAKQYLELGLDLSKKVEDWSMIHDYILLLGEMYEKQGMDEKAEKYYAEADQLKGLLVEVEVIEEKEE